MVIGFGKLLGDSWDFYITNFRALWKVYIWLVIPTLLLAFIDYLIQGINSTPGYIVFGIAMIVAMVFMVLVSIGYMKQTKNLLEGHEESVQEAIFQATPLFWPLVISSIIQTVLVIIGFILLIIPGIILGVYWALMREAVVFRGKKYMNALDYSFSLIRGRWWKVFWYFVGFGLITGAVQLLGVGLDMILLPISESLGALGLVITTAIIFFLSGWIWIAQMMLFFDLEKNKKGSVTMAAAAKQVKAKAVKANAARTTTRKPAKRKVAKKAAKNKAKKSIKRKAAKKSTRKKATKKRRKKSSRQ